MLCRPNSTLKIILNRIKYHVKGTTTLTQANLFCGEKIMVRLPETVSESLVFYHCLEIGLSKILLQYLRPSMIFVDIGAHIGYFTLLGSKLVSSTGIVYSFEPTPNTYKLLCKNVEGKQNIKTINAAAWSTETTLQFNDFGEKFSAFNSFTKPRLSNYKGTINKISVKAIPLDSYFIGILPDFVKIDAETSELEVLKGMNRIISEKHPMISIEVGDYLKDAPTTKECIDYLMDRNYTVLEYGEGKIKPHIIREKYTYDNLFFIKQT